MVNTNHWRATRGEIAMNRVQVSKTKRASRPVRALSNFFNRNTGLLIASAIVFFGLSNIGFQKDNQELLSNTRNSVESNRRIAENTQTIIQDLGQAVDRLERGNEKQTRILCQLILSDGLKLSPSEEREIEQICDVAIKREVGQPAIQNQTPDSTTKTQTNKVPKPKKNTNKSKGRGSGGAGRPQDAPEPSLGDRLRQLPVIGNVIDLVL